MLDTYAPDLLADPEPGDRLLPLVDWEDPAPDDIIVFIVPSGLEIEGVVKEVDFNYGMLTVEYQRGDLTMRSWIPLVDVISIQKATA